MTRVDLDDDHYAFNGEGGPDARPTLVCSAENCGISMFSFDCVRYCPSCGSDFESTISQYFDEEGSR